jgi:hypothetical protein
MILREIKIASTRISYVERDGEVAQNGWTVVGELVAYRNSVPVGFLDAMEEGDRRTTIWFYETDLAVS